MKVANEKELLPFINNQWHADADSEEFLLICDLFNNFIASGLSADKYNGLVFSLYFSKHPVDTSILSIQSIDILLQR